MQRDSRRAETAGVVNAMAPLHLRDREAVKDSP